MSLAKEFRLPGKRTEDTGEKGSTAPTPKVDRAGVGKPRGPIAEELRGRGGVLVEVAEEETAPEAKDPFGTVLGAATTDEQMV